MARGWWRVIIQWATPSEVGVRTFTPRPQMCCLNSREWNVTAPGRAHGVMEPSTSMFALTSYRGARSGDAKFPKLPSGDGGPPTSRPLHLPKTGRLRSGKEGSFRQCSLARPSPRISRSRFAAELETLAFSDPDELDNGIGKGDTHLPCKKESGSGHLPRCLPP